MLGFERLQFAKQRIVLGVGNQRRVEDVVLAVVLLDLRAQLAYALVNAHGARARGQENKRRVSGPPAGRFCAAIIA